MTGTTTRAAMSAFTPAKDMNEKARKAPMTARSPWARLTMRITPNISDRPQANSA